MGVPIWAISVQNEPEAAQTWESCVYTADEEADFIRVLGPALQDAGLGSVKVLCWDHNRYGMLERAAFCYADEEVAKYIWGVGYHWYGDARFEVWPDRYEVGFEDRQRGDGSTLVELRSRSSFENVRLVADLRPDKHIIFTESCQELGDDPLAKSLSDWKLAERYAMNIINDMNSGCEGWIDWNLLLDETGGPNHAHNFCVAPVIFDSQENRVLIQPCYWYLCHFSRYIRPGARRAICSSSRDVLETTAWVNPNGQLIVIVMNQSVNGVVFWLKIAGAGAAEMTAPPRSISTFVVDDGEVTAKDV